MPEQKERKKKMDKLKMSQRPPVRDWDQWMKTHGIKLKPVGEESMKIGPKERKKKS